ncbi:autotransporter domain-containing protein [uncultured Desulfovibrio sp.]|uniref:autotransporter family protein n=1 Tax=uncultured Desulfovibrio sp. TaxID=167968 RepID=UPI0025CC564F|nr:autotransporter domain-containing protein [uncultured Desulfovibrio sp.]
MALFGVEASIADSTFTENLATGTTAQGGAIYNEGTLTVEGSTFTGNKAKGTNGWGGAIYNAGTLTVDGTRFENNTASAQGGAIYVHPKAELDVTNSYFKGNGGTAGGAIAMFGDNGAAPEHSISNTVFEGNTAYRTEDKLGKGGAIAILEMDTPREKYTTKLDLNGVTFIGNTSNGTGGAIHSEYGTLTITDATFSGNSAEQQGGAIYNDANSSITFKGDNLFTGNTAAEGKDIYNEGTLDFAGTNTQMDGGMVMAGGTMTVANSQVNMAELDARAGNITVTGSELGVSKLTGNTLGSSLTVDTDGIVNIGNLDTTKLGEAMNDAGMGSGSAVLALNTTMTLDNNARLVVGTDASENKATAVFGENSLLVVDAEGVADKQAIHADGHDTKTAFIHSGAQLRIINAVAGEYVTVLNGFDTIQNEDGVLEASWTNKDGVDNLDYMLSSYAMIMEGSDGQPDVVVVSELNDPTAALPGIDPDLAPVLNEVWANKLNDVDSPDMGVRFLSRAARADYINGDAAKSAATIESAARIAFAGAVPQMTKMASDAATNAVVNRLGFANPADGAQAMNAEGKIVDRNTTGFALWIAPLWQNQHGWGMEAGNLDYGFNGNLGGVSLGADYTFENAIRAGITFNIGGGYAESSGGDLNSTENRMTFWGLGAYAGWNYENFGLMADVSYTSTWNDLEQDLDPGMGMGDLEADVQATAISAGLRAEYKLETSVLDIIPHIGVRYMSLNTWGYDVDANGGTVLEGDGFHQDIWTFPIGVTFSKDFTLDSGWFFKPSVDFSVIPAAGDIKAKHDVQFTGAPAVAEMETQMMDYLTWQGGVGIQMGNDNLSFGVNYTLQAGQNTTGHGVFGSFRYEF